MNRSWRLEGALTVAVVATLACSGPRGPSATPTPTPHVPPAPAPNADYGDAPDGTATGYLAPGAATGDFPSLWSHPGHGPTHELASLNLTLGPTVTAEPDALLTDLDADDLHFLLWQVGVNDGHTLAPDHGAFQVEVDATGSDPSKKVEGFLNVALDLDRDGDWDSPTEWVVKNTAVGVPQGGTEDVWPPPFSYGPTDARADVWGRLTLTPSAISGAWDGSLASTASLGETEDVFFKCVGELRITYPATEDLNKQRLNAGNGIFVDVLVENLASEAITYMFSARTFKAVTFGMGYFYVPNDAPVAYTAVLTAAGTALNEDAAPKAGFSLSLTPAGTPGGGDSRLVRVQVTPTNDWPWVVDATAAPPHDDRLGYVRVRPLGPCLRRLEVVGKSRVYLETNQ